MKKFMITFAFVVLVTSKPIIIDEDHAETNIDNITSVDGLHYGDRLDSYAPTTPRDPASISSLTYILPDFPEKPYQDEPEYDGNDNPKNDSKISKRSVNLSATEAEINKNFFDSIYQFSRAVRGAEHNGTIPLDQLVSAVESTLVHSAQNLATAKLEDQTIHVSSAQSSGASITAIQPPIVHSPLAININENKNKTKKTITITKETREDKLNEADSASIHKRSATNTGDIEVVKPIVETRNLGLLSPIAFSVPNANSPRAQTINLSENQEAVNNHSDKSIIYAETITEVTPSLFVTPHDQINNNKNTLTTNDPNIEVIPPIIIHHFTPTESSRTTQETSSNIPFLPTIPTAQIRNFDANKYLESISSDCSDSSDEKNSNNDSSSTSSEESKIARKCFTSTTQKPTKHTESKLIPTSNTTPRYVSSETAIKSNSLKEKIAEVEADPVILTQGI